MNLCTWKRIGAQKKNVYHVSFWCFYTRRTDARKKWLSFLKNDIFLNNRFDFRFFCVVFKTWNDRFSKSEKDLSLDLCHTPPHHNSKGKIIRGVDNPPPLPQSLIDKSSPIGIALTIILTLKSLNSKLNNYCI